VCLVQRTSGIGFWGNRDASDMKAELQKQENEKRGDKSDGCIVRLDSSFGLMKKHS